MVNFIFINDSPLAELQPLSLCTFVYICVGPIGVAVDLKGRILTSELSLGSLIVKGLLTLSDLCADTAGNSILVLSASAHDICKVVRRIGHPRTSSIYSF